MARKTSKRKKSPTPKARAGEASRKAASKAAKSEKTTKQRLLAARKGKAARLKPVKAQIKADAKAMHGETSPWTKAEIEEAFRRFAAANPEPRGELHHINPYTLLVAVRRRPMPVSTRRRRLCSRSPTRRKKWSSSAKRGCAT
jgi:endonuclease-3